VPSSVSMKNAAATIRAIRIARSFDVSVEAAESKGEISNQRAGIGTPNRPLLELQMRSMNAVLKLASDRVQRPPL
jgi:hypothetical protein